MAPYHLNERALLNISDKEEYIPVLVAMVVLVLIGSSADDFKLAAWVPTENISVCVFLFNFKGVFYVILILFYFLLAYSF